MYKNRGLTALIAAVLAAILSWGAVMCLVTGFSLAEENPEELLRYCLIFSIVGSILFSVPYGGRGFALLTALMAGYLWQLRTPVEQLLGLVQRISMVYDSAYGWGHLWFSDKSQNAAYPLMAVGYLVSGFTTRCVCRGKHSFPAVAAVGGSAAVCFVVTDTVPQPGFLYLIMAGVALLVITGRVRRQNIRQADRLTGLALVPVLVTLALLFWCQPRDAYVDRSGTLRSFLLAGAERVAARLESVAAGLAAGPQQTSGNVDLAGLGRRFPSSYPVMQVTAEITGALYLRAWDCDRYTGTGWQRSTDRQEAFSTADEAAFHIRISTENPYDYRFVPYYPAGDVNLTGGMTPNPGQAQDYEYAAGHLTTAAEGVEDAFLQEERYLALPRETQIGAWKILIDRQLFGQSDRDTASRIGEFVRNCAGYDLSPDTMPRNQQDFAIWFLESADRGYCIHFATAAVVLLRAAEIPARYATGYLVRAIRGETVTVTQKEAHAWAEYYDSRLGAWMVLEATPPDPDSANGAAEEPAAQERGPSAALPTPETILPSAPEDGTVPQAPKPEGEEPDRGWLRGMGRTAAAAGGILLLAQGQRKLRQQLRRRRQRRGSNSRRGLALWQEVVLLHRLLKETPEEGLLGIAQKAKFSHREPEAEELEQLENCLQICRQRLRQLPWYQRLLSRYWFAAY